jgi:alkanesulfonate monooxygenase SsuD/methylene tetrahydromethanopterin reductase-like flavin-dependent oxidoreductase (luciferase family)
LGLGAGYHEPEHRAFGYPFDHLVGRFEEALQIIHPLLRQGAVDFHGKYHQATNCELRPRASRSAGPPILIGTARPDRPRMLRLCAQYADYWNIVWANQMADLLPALQAIDAACAKTGRNPATLRRSVAMAVVLPAAEQQRTTENWARFLFRRPPATGTVEQLADHLRTYAQKGIDHVQLWIEPFTMSGIEAFLPVLETLDRG